MVWTLLQLRATGTDLSVAVAVIGLSLLSIALSLGIAVQLARGYRRTAGNARVLGLAVGLLFLTTVPELLRIGLPTVTGLGVVGRSVLVSGSELLGLGSILWAVYGSGSQ
ncbi:hypothetical protein SAMN04488063_2787 [Halopelagius inordinatus]|uniref:Uncharacterized protein n=1 Tax=Halopelagius inordinatus TaxID=553467 RepID=A0A1I2U7I5_9EURY|nr:hypothetical protein [Halopelagius inordinatus]SFG72339.1 hypothetical protein SAMN04488063_2787 [Halopelagius inordinatus]